MSRAFLVLWFGQTISVVGSGLTMFALSLWVYQQTGSVTQFTLISVLSSAPLVFLSPVAGALVDRWDRRRTMLAADLISGAAVLVLYLLHTAGALAIWHIYLANVVAALATAFHWPAYAAATTLMVAKRHLGRAAGLAEFSRAASVTLAPLLATVLVLGFGLSAVLVLNVTSFLFAAACLASVTVPAPQLQPRESLRSELRAGWRYIADRPGLLRLLGQFAMMNLLVGFVMVLVIPLVLSATSERNLGLTATIATIGFTIGGAVMSAWGGPPKRARAIVLCGLIEGVAMIVAGLRPSAVLIAAGLFCFYFWIPVINGCSQAIWQAKVPPAIQGRIFAIRRMLAQATTPVAYLLAGPLADHIFIPLLLPGGTLAAPLGPLLGIGPGRGVGLLFLALGAICLTVNALFLRSRPLMSVERDLPDVIGDTSQDFLTKAQARKS